MRELVIFETFILLSSFEYSLLNGFLSAPASFRVLGSFWIGNGSLGLPRFSFLGWLLMSCLVSQLVSYLVIPRCRSSSSSVNFRLLNL